MLSFEVDVSGAWKITFEVEQTYGGNYQQGKTNYALNMAMYDAEFVTLHP